MPRPRRRDHPFASAPAPRRLDRGRRDAAARPVKLCLTVELETIGGAVAPAAVFNAAPVAPPKKSFVDFQNDVTLADVDLAWLEDMATRSIQVALR